jgi:tRNA threonylcarbamoyl adenosine modification protein YeaZ
MTPPPPKPDDAVLAIEVSNPALPPGGSVAIARWGGLRAGEVLAHEQVAPSTRERDDLLCAIDRVARRAGVRPAGIRVVAVSIGPGGYTSLRVAVAAGKMIAAGSGGVCVGVPTASVIAARARAQGVDGPLAVALASKNDAVFLTLFDGPVHLRPGAMAGPEAVDPARPHTLIADDHLPAPWRARALGAGWSIRPPLADAGALLALVADAPRIEPEALVPLYGREPEAVTLWRSRHAPPPTA